MKAMSAPNSLRFGSLGKTQKQTKPEKKLGENESDYEKRLLDWDDLYNATLEESKIRNYEERLKQRIFGKSKLSTCPEGLSKDKVVPDNINEPSNFRYFYAGACNRTWPKIFVLSKDGTLYCEYLDHYRPSTFKKKFNYETFDAADFKWGGYQTIVEIDKEVAIKTRLTKQSNWVLNYIRK